MTFCSLLIRYVFNYSQLAFAFIYISNFETLSHLFLSSKERVISELKSTTYIYFILFKISFIWVISSSCDFIMLSESFRNSGSFILAFLLVIMAEEWCGIIAFIYCVLLTNAWLLKAVKAKTNTAIEEIVIIEFSFLFGNWLKTVLKYNACFLSPIWILF